MKLIIRGNFFQLSSIQVDDWVLSWFRNRVRHREDGPAVLNVNGTRFWYTNGELHREDGPAVVYASGDRLWYSHGKRR